MRQFQDDWKQAEAQALPTDEERGTKLRPLHQEDVSSTVELTEPLASARQLSYLLVKYSTRLTTTDQQMLAFIQQEREIELASRLTQHLLHPMKNTQGETVTACSLPDHHGMTEGLVHKLKPIKGSLYGRGSFELLRQRVLQPAA